MRGLLMVLPVLLATLLQPACSSFSPKSTTSNSLKENPEVLASVEASLLSLFGFKRRPRPGKVVVPEVMLELYRQQTGNEVDTSALPLPGRHTHTANTVRSFPHIGKSNCIQMNFLLIPTNAVHILTTAYFHNTACSPSLSS